MRRMLSACLGLAAAALALAPALAPAPPAFAGTEPGPEPAAPETTVPAADPTASTLAPAMGPLIVVPAGCAVPAPALAVFTGTITALDDPQQPTTARFLIDRQLYGDLGPYLIAGETDVLYGEEARFLAVGVRYIVGVRAADITGRLVSTVREQAPMFGGDAVIGLNDGDTECPTLEDPVRTFLADGAAVDTGVLAPLHGEGDALLWAVLKPLLLALAALIALVGLKQAAFAMARSLRDPAGDRYGPLPPVSPGHPARAVMGPRRTGPPPRRPAQRS